MIKKFFLLSLFTIFVQGNFSPIFSGRPFVTDDAGAVEKGLFELETGSDFGKDALSFGICLTHGITNHMDIGLGFGYNSLPDNSRSFQSAELVMKFCMIPEFLSLTASGTFGEQTYSVNSILSKNIGPAAFDINLGMSTTTGSSKADLTYGLCCHYSNNRFCTGVELGGSDSRLEIWQVGCNCSLCKWLSIDAGLAGDFNKDITLTGTNGFTFFISHKNMNITED